MTRSLRLYLVIYCVITFAFWLASFSHEAFFYDPGFTDKQDQPVEPVYAAVIVSWLWYFVPVRLIAFTSSVFIFPNLRTKWVYALSFLFLLTITFDFLSFAVIGQVVLPVLKLLFLNG